MEGSVHQVAVVARPEHMPRILDFITSTLAALQVDGPDAFDIQLAVEEACANIIRHSYRDQEPGPLVVRLARARDEIRVEIADFGPPFDPRQVPPPDLRRTVDQGHEGGLGVHLMRRLMDRVEHRFAAGIGNELVMTKRIHPRSP